VDQSPDGVNGSRSIGEHGGDTDKDTAEPSEKFGVREVFEKLALKLTDELEDKHKEDDDADDASRGLVIEGIEEEPGADDCAEGDGDERPDHLPTSILSEERVDEEIADDEHGQNDADAVFGTEKFGDDENVDDRKTGKSGLGDAQAEGAQAGKGQGRARGVKGQFHRALS